MNETRPTLLVVDDEPEVLRSVQEIHVVMSDQRMPEMTGVELLHHAKQIRPDATRLLFTAYADVRAIVDAINEGGVFRYIAKPWDPEELEGVIRQAVEQHNLLVEKARLLEQLQQSNRQLVEANRLKAAFIEV